MTTGNPFSSISSTSGGTVRCRSLSICNESGRPRMRWEVSKEQGGVIHWVSDDQKTKLQLTGIGIEISVGNQSCRVARCEQGAEISLGDNWIGIDSERSGILLAGRDAASLIVGGPDKNGAFLRLRAGGIGGGEFTAGLGAWVATSGLALCRDPERDVQVESKEGSRTIEVRAAKGGRRARISIVNALELVLIETSDGRAIWATNPR